MSENGTGSVIAAPTPEQYRRRRAIAGALAALILLLLIWGMVSLVNAIRGGDDENVTGAVATATTAPFSDFSERPQESESAVASESATAEESEEASPSAEPTETAVESPSAEASETPVVSPTAEPAETPEATVTAEPTASAEPSESAEPTPSAEPTVNAAPVACTANDLRVSLTADQNAYAAGANPALAVTYTNAAGTPCLVGGDVKSIDINITSGPAQVYNSSVCQASPQAEAELAAGATNTVVMTWNRQINALGCASAATAQPGYYWATATVNGVTSTPTRIIING